MYQKQRELNDFHYIDRDVESDELNDITLTSYNVRGDTNHQQLNYL